jgi:hypothetical protein
MLTHYASGVGNRGGLLLAAVAVVLATTQPTVRA